MTLTQLMEADHIHSYIAVTMQPNDWDEALTWFLKKPPQGYPILIKRDKSDGEFFLEKEGREMFECVRLHEYYLERQATLVETALQKHFSYLKVPKRLYQRIGSGSNGDTNLVPANYRVLLVFSKPQKRIMEIAKINPKSESAPKIESASM